MSGNKPAEWEATYEKAHVHSPCGFPIVEPGPISNYQEFRFTYVADQIYRNQSEALCAVRNVEPRACRANGSARNAVARLRFAVRNVAPRLQPTPSFALIAAPRLPPSHGRALIRRQSHPRPRKRFAYTRACRCFARDRR